VDECKPLNPGGKFGDEQVGLQLRHMKKGILSMSNSARNANGSQFIITMVRRCRLTLSNPS
jgi:cyclophilin family peptidyl-prolyl cis-trans isomerase